MKNEAKQGTAAPRRADCFASMSASPRRAPPLSEAKLAQVHARLRKASYVSGGPEWASNVARLFAQYDKDRSGALELGELTMAARASLKLNRVELPDA